MKSLIWASMALVLMTAPAMAQKVYIDYDANYDRSQIKTFQWAPTSETGLAMSQPLLHSRIVNGIEYYLTLNGGTEADTDPDVYVTYHTNTKEDVSFNTSTMGYGYPGGWAYGGYYGRYGYGYGGWGGGMSTTTVTTYVRGTLVVDVWDARTKELVWRGMAANITVSDNPSKMAKRIDKALKKIVGQWRKIKARDEKAATKR